MWRTTNKVVARASELPGDGRSGLLGHPGLQLLETMAVLRLGCFFLGFGDRVACLRAADEVCQFLHQVRHWLSDGVGWWMTKGGKKVGSWEDLLTENERGSHEHLRSRDEGPQDAAGPVVGDLRQVTHGSHVCVQ